MFEERLALFWACCFLLDGLMTRKAVTEILQCSVIFLDCSGRSSNRGNKAPIYHFYIQNLFKPCYWALFFVIDLGFISVHENKQTNKQMKRCHYPAILTLCLVMHTCTYMDKFVEFFRHMTFVFLQLGEVLFVDLRLKMMVASVEVKESIKSLELMQDKQHETTALLVNILPFFY